VDQRVLMYIVNERLPRLADHLDRLRVSLPLLATPWFMSMFVGELPTETVLRIWDCYFYEGPVMLFRVALALLMSAERSILASRMTADVITVVKTTAKRCFDADALIKMAFVEVCGRGGGGGGCWW